MRQEFKVHRLTETGLAKAAEMAQKYSDLVEYLEGSSDVCMPSPELTIAKRKLEESCFYAKKAMAMRHCQPEG